LRSVPEPRPVPRLPERGHELGWLRFFFEARKAMRRLEPGRPRLEAILETMERDVGAVAGIAVAGPGGWWVRIRPGSPAILRHLAVVLGDPGGESLTGGRLPDVDLRFSAGGFPGALAVFLPTPGGSLADEPASGRPAGDRGAPGVVPEKYLDELSALLVEAVDRPTNPAQN